ncbi:UDP-N-acetylmuramoyl-L-alanyl-D-glutamate--2,6-diaminopimelate ligase [Bacteroidia bacterium]|nr:UDP-N-acetylmuramoyl-L-alanyl-D-glutamate--2,6-diaminopimelate ligase [Bacteroidia bacterium]
MTLEKLLQNITPVKICGDSNIEIAAIECNSSKVSAGACFVAQRGTKVDGHTFIADAIAKGAAAVVCDTYPLTPSQREGEQAPPCPSKREQERPFGGQGGVCFVQVQNSDAALGQMAANFYGQPSAKLKLVGVTGTNGKTTTATLLYDLFERLGYKCGLISTVIYKVHQTSIASTHTTPDALKINELLAQMVSEGCEYCFVEVSSHSIVQRRIEGLHFAGGIFTNLTHDHLDYHKTFDEYLKAKKLFFDHLPAAAFALTNGDEKNGRVMVQNTKAKVSAYALHTLAEFKCKIIEQHLDGMLLNINGTEFWTPLIGDFNAYNISAIYGAAVLLGVNHETLAQNISALHAVAGRFEYVKSASGITAIVDYAHTPDALQNVIDTINRLRVAGQQLITVVGCGGDRDKTKRPVMAAVATANSDRVILTSDNPRTENPRAILDDMFAGVEANHRKKTLVIEDRREAIKTAVNFANPQDIILVAGKGHEDYQIIGTTKHHFDDKEILVSLMKNE